MICAWEHLYMLFPNDLRRIIQEKHDETLQEIRLRIGQRAEMVLSGTSKLLDKLITQDDISYVVNSASRYSPWSAETMKDGYITALGGHRIGFCGEAVIKDYRMEGIRTVSSLCVRVAKDYPGVSGSMSLMHGSALVIGCPGSGKTTFLRDLIRNRSENDSKSICVIDERGELFPVFKNRMVFSPGPRTDIMTMCKKPQGIVSALKTMGPGCIAVDEITAQEDLDALIQAAWCGVDVLATLHARNMIDMQSNKRYKCILDSGIFERYIVMNGDKSWKMERKGL